MLGRIATFAGAALIAVMANASAALADDYYGEDCHQRNAETGTILGAIAGGIIGNQFGHGGGKVAATVGGVFIGGAAGNAIAGDMDCDDRRYAFRAYHDGFYGPIGQRVEWHNDAEGDYGYFTPIREYWDGPRLCRDFDIQTYRHGRWHEHQGTACREEDGNWHFI